MVSLGNLFSEYDIGRTDSVLEKVLGWGCAYVRPVDRLIPARKAETVDEVSLQVRSLRTYTRT